MESTNTKLPNVELLAIIKISEVIAGIHYIQSLLIEDESVEAFWNYFAKILLKAFPPSTPYRI
ncbi:hypothetical protein HZS_8053 [Henneguya salminicola]|nr:hypothetical protein HZS_8053 [Henneguya salminicola]